MQAHNTLKTALIAFSKEIEILQTDLANYQKTKTYSEKFGFYKKQQIAQLAAIYNTFINAFEELTQDLITKSKQLGKKENQILILEGVCILHGIDDLSVYYQKTPHQIINLVLEAYQENWRQIPYAIQFKDEKAKPIKFADKPTVDFNTLFSAAQNNRNNDTQKFNHK